jgi:hypothetical protein
MRTNHQGQRRHPFRVKQAVDMTAPETFTTASKRSLTTGRRPDMTAICVRREKAALSSGCKPHPANAPAGSNRSSHGGDEMAEAFGIARRI